MSDIPKATSIQTGRKMRQDFQNNNIDFQEEDPSENTEVPSFVNNLIQNSGNIEEEESPSIQDYNLIENKDSKVNNNKKSMKYNIISLFWLVNENNWDPKHEKDYKEAQFVTISYNADFGNLKITYYAIPNGAIEGNVVFEQSLQRLISGTIYPASCFRAIQMPVDTNITCMEQLIRKTGEQWEKERPYVFIHKKSEEVTIKIADVNTEDVFWFSFRGWQREVLEYCLKYTYGEGVQIKGFCNALKNLA